MTQGRDLQWFSVLRTLMLILGRGATVRVHVKLHAKKVKSVPGLQLGFVKIDNPTQVLEDPDN